ncbi:MAG: sodium:solute symporter [Aureispira sp.]
MNDTLLTGQWALVIGSSLVLLLLSPTAKTVKSFFKAETQQGKAPNFWLLTSSLVISWIFAKSITVAADLGAAYGLVGGVAYAAYYLSFCVAGIVIYQLRKQGGFESIHQFLAKKHGQSALWLFSILIAIRLFNEVWSNTMVIGSYFGAAGTSPYYWAIVVFTGLTLLYSLKGGMRSSMFTDAIQMALFGVLLAIVLSQLIPNTEGGVTRYVQEGTWSMATGVNLLLVALLQAFSYPFHDPVMTDRGFVAPPKITLRSFLWAGVIGGICIILFSLVGVYARIHGLEGSAPVAVSKSLSIPMLLIMNFIMITSASSTLDSTFSSFSKLITIDLGNAQAITVTKGRLTMAILAVLGVLPVFLNPEILSATTVSGTMVIGLAPVFVCWKWKVPAYSFHLSVGMGLLTGFVLVMGCPDSLLFFEGKYGDLLSLNLIGSTACFIAFLAPKFFISKQPVA